MNSNKVVLIMPRYGRAARQSGLGYLAASLKDRQFMSRCRQNFTHELKDNVSINPFDVTVIDLRMAPNDFCLSRYLAAEKPLIVGSTAFQYNYLEALNVGLITEKSSPESLRIIGGWQASPLARETLEKSTYQIVVRNEGEETLVELATLFRAFRTEKAFELLPQIEGLTFRDQDGKIVETTTHRPKIGLDHYPLVVEGFDSFKFGGYFEDESEEGKTAFITGSRGCMFSCIFCANPAIYTHKIRFRSPENILSEIRELYHRGYRVFSFRDELFTANTKWAQAIMDGIKMLQREGIFISWFCQTRADLLTEQMLLDMKGSGLIKLSFGIESGDEELARFLKGGHFDLKRSAENISLAQETGIANIQYYIFGAPGQTWQSMFKSVRFLQENMPSMIGTQTIHDYPGTKMKELDKPVVPAEAALAQKVFENIFHWQNLPNILKGSEDIVDLPVKQFSNIFRFAVMFDLFIRSKSDYSDKERVEILQKLAFECSHDNNLFVKVYLKLIINSEKGLFKAYNPVTMQEKLAKEIFESLVLMPDFAEGFGIHPKVAEAYFDEFLSNLSLGNSFETLKGFSFENIVKIFAVCGMIWEIIRQSELKTPEIIEFDEDKEENTGKLKKIIEAARLMNVANAINDAFEDGVKGDFELNLIGLPILVDIEAGKIIIKISEFEAKDGISVSFKNYGTRDQARQ